MEHDVKNMQLPEGIIEIWQRIVDSAAIFLSVPGVMINRLEPPDIEVLRSNNSPDSPLPAGTRMSMKGLYCTSVSIRRQMLQVNDARRNPQWSDSPTAKSGIVAYLGVPLSWPDGGTFGTLCVVDRHTNEWGPRAENLLRTLKDAIESHLELIMNGADLTSSTTELEAALNRVLTLQGFSPLVPAENKKPG